MTMYCGRKGFEKVVVVTVSTACEIHKFCGEDIRFEFFAPELLNLEFGEFVRDVGRNCYGLAPTPRRKSLALVLAVWR